MKRTPYIYHLRKTNKTYGHLHIIYYVAVKVLVWELKYDIVCNVSYIVAYSDWNVHAASVAHAFVVHFMRY